MLIIIIFMVTNKYVPIMMNLIAITGAKKGMGKSIYAPNSESSY